MHTDVVYEALHPFHLWAWIAAACAFALAAASASIFAHSPRFSRRWWQGMGILVPCFLAIAFGARSRATAYAFRPSTRGCDTPGRGVDTPEVVAAQQLVTILGVALLIVTALSIAATILLLRRTNAMRPRPSARILSLFVAIFIAGCGAFLTTNSVADWLQFAYLADITRAGDSLGQLPLIFAIFGTISGAVMLAIGLAAVIGVSLLREESSPVGLPAVE